MWYLVSKSTSKRPQVNIVMAEALYPEEPPPSYESQFIDHRTRMNPSPLPSAPPFSHPERPCTHNLTSSTTPPPVAPVANPRRAYRKVAVSQHETIPEKTDLSRPQPHRRAPPPPPPSLNRSKSHPQGHSSKTRPQSSIQLGSYNETNVQAGSYAEIDSLTHPRRSEATSSNSTSVYDITQPYNTHQHHQYYEQNPHHHNPMPPIQAAPEFHDPQRALEFNQPHLYESLHMQAPPPQVNSQCINAATDSEQVPHQVNFRRQMSAPSPAKRRYRRVSLPPESHAHSGGLQGDSMHTTNHSTQSANYAHVQPTLLHQGSMQPALHDSDPHSITEAAPCSFVHQSTHPQQQVQAVQPLRQVHVQPQIHRSFSEQSSMGSCLQQQQQQPMEVAAVKPLPKPRNMAATPTEQVLPIQPLQLSMQPLPLATPVLPMTTHSQQQSTQQFTTTQQVATFPGQTQVQTYSFAQQASVVTIPGFAPTQGGPQPMTSNSPTVVNISPTFPPAATMSVQLVERDPSIKPQLPSSTPVDSNGERPDEASSLSNPSDGLLAQNSSSNLNASIRPVPKPRRVKRQSSDAELSAGNESCLELSEGDTGRAANGDNGGTDVEEDLAELAELQVTELEAAPDTQRLAVGQSEEDLEEQLLSSVMESVPAPEEGTEAPAKPPRRHVRKPPPPPPNGRARAKGRPSSAPATPQAQAEASAVSAQELESEAAAVVSQESDPPQEPTTPSGYRIRDIFFNSNIIFLLPLSDPLRLPLRAAGRSLKGRGTFKNDCKFEIVYLSSAIGHEQTVLVVMLKCFSRMNRFLAINQKGKVKITKGAAEKCKFVVRGVSDRPLLRYGVVTLESAIHPGWFLTITSSGRTRRCGSSGPPARMDESKFAVRVERIFNPYASCLVNFGRPSVLHQLRDRSVVQLASKTSARFLCLNLKGRVLQDTGNRGDVTTHFVVYDRGMGVVSLRSNRMTKMWLRAGQSKIQGGARPDLATDFRVTEAPDGTIQFESILSPGLYLTFPCEQMEIDDSQLERNFFVRNVAK